MVSEKRNFTRVPFKVEAEIIANETLYKIKEITNLSIEGCLIPVDADLKLGTSCKITIFLSGVTPKLTIKADGEVIRLEEHYLAIKFIRVDPDSLFHLQNIVRYNSQNPEKVEWEILNHPEIS